MTALRIRMIKNMQLRGFFEYTQETYVRAVRQLSTHYHKSPDQITEEELRQYFLYNKNIRKWSRTAITIALYDSLIFIKEKRDLIFIGPTGC